MRIRPFSVTVTSIVIVLYALIWLVLGIIIAVNAQPALPVPPELKAILAVLSILMAGILTGLFVFLLKGNRVAYFLIIAFFFVVSILTIFDDVGVSDIIVLVLNIIPIILLIKDRNWYRRVRPQANAGA